MRLSKLTSILSFGLVMCVTPLHCADAYSDDLPAVESRSTTSDDHLSQEPSNRSVSAPRSASSENPLQLIEEDNLNQAPTSVMPETPAARMDQLQQQVQELRGKLEIQEHRFQELSKQLSDNYQDLDARIKVLVEAQAALSAKPAPAVVVAEPGKENPATALSVGPEPKENTNAEDEKALYQKAYGLAQAKKYDASVEAFNQLIQTHPKSTYVPTAYFWMGEIYVVQAKYDLATNSFNQIITLYPTSPKVSEAMFKLGYVAYARGNNKLASKHFTEVKTRYPGTAAAKQADNYLRKLKPKSK